MKSKRRDGLREFIGEEGVFLATVQDYDYKRRHLVLTDVATKCKKSKGILIIAKHLHVYNVDSKLLKKINKPNIISFRATAYVYSKKHVGETLKNFSLENIREITVIRGEYDGE